MSFSYNGRVFLTDSEGFLLNKDEWSENLMLFMAQNLGLTLTEQHKIVIYEVRAYYKEYATTPAMRLLISTLKKKGHTDLASSVTLARLFPDGAAKTAAKLAGLPKPVKCI